jgi:transketolase
MVVSKTGNVGDTYGGTLLELGKKNEQIVAVEADLMKASGSGVFKEVFPERHFNVGIAEQNLVGVASGLARMGKIPFASAFAGFLSQRACDQDYNAIAFDKVNAKLVGTYGGLTQEKNGGMHIGVEDIAIFRCMPNMTVIVPGDCVELAGAVVAAAEYEGPVFLRIARGPLEQFLPDNYKFKIGKAVILEDGSDISLITTGITTWQGKLACKKLRTEGIGVRHIHMPTIKPIDRYEILRAARETGAIVTVENHSRLGGLGSSVTEVVCDQVPVPVTRLGLDDRFGQTASLDWLLNEYGISDGHIVSAVKETLSRKK